MVGLFSSCVGLSVVGLSVGQLLVALEGPKPHNNEQHATTRWTSGAVHSNDQVLTWTGHSNAALQTIGVQIDWSAAPGPWKMLGSPDGGNFEELAPWHGPSRPERSYTETIVFNTTRSIQSITLAMRKTPNLNYVGLNSVKLLVDSYSCLLLVDDKVSTEHQCVVAVDGHLRTEPCLEAIAHADDRELWQLDASGRVVHLSDDLCVTTDSGDSSTVKVSSCSVLDLSGGSLFALDAEDRLQFGPTKVTPIAVRGTRLSASSQSTKDLVQVLRAAVSRQEKQLATLKSDLQEARQRNCRLPHFAASFLPATAVLNHPGTVSGAKVETQGVRMATDPSLVAVESIDRVLGVDLLSLNALIRETKHILRG